MTKLKTLKDIEKLYDLGGEIFIRELDEEGRSRIVTKGKQNRKAFLNNLKQEAVKHIDILKQACIINEHRPNDLMYCGCKDNEIDWIKYFFNIIEDDLKLNKNQKVLL